MRKFFKILLINIFIFIFLIFLADGIIWLYENFKLKPYGQTYIGKWPIPFHSGVKHFQMDLDYYPNPNEGWGRETEGLNYKKKPVVFFGCSYVYGYLLDKDQTLTYKIAANAKRPVYSRAFQGWGIQHMLYQVRQQKFYDQVQEPEYAIFLMMFDHFRRLYSINLMSANMLNEERALRYKIKDDTLVEITDSNPFLNSAKRLYLINKLHQAYVKHIILREDNYDEYSRFALKHFIESKQEMEKHWKNTKYIVLYYNDFYNEDEFTKALEDNGFQVISLPALTNVDLEDEKYKITDGHPSEEAFEIISQALIKELKL